MEVPEKWNKQSVVILHHAIEIELYKERKNRIGLAFLNHYRLKLQDEAALTDFSEMYFSDESHSNNRSYKGENRIRGIKIIKPDGREENIDMVKEMVVEGKGSRERKKMAIPNLQIGDIIDYYDYYYETANPAFNYGIIKY